jgi:hypothetical protein
MVGTFQKARTPLKLPLGPVTTAPDQNGLTPLSFGRHLKWCVFPGAVWSSGMIQSSTRHLRDVARFQAAMAAGWARAVGRAKGNQCFLS